MAFKPNYNQQRADRNRAKEAKKAEKLRRLEDETAQRKALANNPQEGASDDAPGEQA